MADKKTIRMVTWNPTATGVMLAFDAIIQGAALKTSDDFDFADECQRRLRPEYRRVRGPIAALKGDFADEEVHERLCALDQWEGIDGGPPALLFSPGAWTWLKARIEATPCPPHMAAARRRTVRSIGQASEGDVAVEA